MPELLQHVIVTIVALGAAGVIVRRVFGVVQPAGGNPQCASCPSARAHGMLPPKGGSQPAAGPAGGTHPAATSGVKPLTFVR